ncbi:MAG: bifunctional folylpolyglutamate synthase/dihydrofolate synthase [Culturomica sp.]|jgi:dihydrofolate synthase/folylpolyglutamate synthase|nr:bifunctional folylpolyglutamate synthase/dihydrofolate synthase [Culturomica sp.]
MNYQETIEWMYAQLPMFQREGKSAYKANLNNTLKLDSHFGSPHRSFKTVHIAGTNGKGSSSHAIASILQEAGYKTGLYTSPHLRDFRERIKINGEMISEEFVTEFINSNKNVFTAIKPSFFEMTVAMAFSYFKDMKTEIAVIETGLGGRLDSTNIIKPLISLITNISFDHCALLGDTLPLIAQEKAGIIKPNTPVVVGTRDKDYDFVFEEAARKNHAPLVFASDKWEIERSDDGSYNLHSSDLTLNNLQMDLQGHYQIKNLPGIIETVLHLQQLGLSVSENNIRKGLANVISNTGLFGRWQVLSEKPYTVCDTGHNEDGLREVVKQIKTHNHKCLHFVIGVVNDKDTDHILPLLPKNAVYYFTKASIPRALDENILAKKAAAHDLQGNTYPTVHEAYEAARSAAKEDDMIFIGGSTYIVAETV